MGDAGSLSNPPRFWKVPKRSNRRVAGVRVLWSFAFAVAQRAATMVSFICNQCQDTLKKGKVEKHLAGCKATLLSCVDCGNEFDTAQYVLHST